MVNLLEPKFFQRKEKTFFTDTASEGALSIFFSSLGIFLHFRCLFISPPQNYHKAPTDEPYRYPKRNTLHIIYISHFILFYFTCAIFSRTVNLTWWSNINYAQPATAYNCHCYCCWIKNWIRKVKKLNRKDFSSLTVQCCIVCWNLLSL